MMEVDLLLFTATAASAVYFKRKEAARRMLPSSFVLSKNDTDIDAAAELRKALEAGTSLNADERICTVTGESNQVIAGGGLRAQMRLQNLWHRATYVLIFHCPVDDEHATSASVGTAVAISNNRNKNSNLSDTFVLVQKRSALKDYCPLKLDPLPGGVVGYGESYRENAVREMQEEMGINVEDSLTREFTFPYSDGRVRVWGEVYECTYRGSMDDLVTQQEEVECVFRLSLQELKDRIEQHPDDFMPDACHAMRLYFQRLGDLQVKRRLMKGYSSGNLDAYGLRPKPRVIFFDCDDCLYFDGWKTANQLTRKIDEWCINHGLRKGQAYDLYKEYGTALRGLLAEGYLDETEDAIDGFLSDVHDIPVHDLLQPDDELREMLLRIDPTIPKYIFTASVKEHAARCLEALNIADLFVDIIDCKACDLETKHSTHSFESAMRIAGVEDPEHCLFLDDNLKNISAARKIGWRSVLVGKVCRDHGNPVSSEHAELEIDRIHSVPEVLPELFGASESM